MNPVEIIVKKREAGRKKTMGWEIKPSLLRLLKSEEV